MSDGGSRADYGYEEQGQEGKAYSDRTLNHDVIHRMNCLGSLDFEEFTTPQTVVSSARTMRLHRSRWSITPRMDGARAILRIHFIEFERRIQNTSIYQVDDERDT